MPRNIPYSVASFFALFFLVSPAWAQVGYLFGQNKVLYKDFNWAVFRTEHFDVYYYPEEEKAAHDVARMAERGYDYLSDVLDHEIKGRIPLILYASLNDFQQTNVVQGILDQGTRGVTESLKGRIVLPITGSYRELNHVLVHEMVHAFQFDLMFNSEVKNKGFSPPLWFVEGMAEYLSVGMDTITRMWVRDGLLNDKLLTISQLDRAYDIRVYRLGQSVWHYIGEQYGKEMVGQLFKTALRKGHVEMAIKEALGMDSKELTEAWHEYVRTRVLSQDSALQAPDHIAEQITRQQGTFHRMNLVPSVSPDGEYIAYVANKDLNEDIYLLSKDERDEWQDERLIEGGESMRFEALRYFDTSLGWAWDGTRIAFVSKSGERDVLYIMNPHTGEITDTFTLDELSGLQSPVFSPQGDRLALVGISGGMADLYILHLGKGTLERLTHDRFAVLHPQWSPDGTAIVFVTDRGTGTDEEALLFGDYDLALYHLPTGHIEMITDLGGNATSPQWSPDGRRIAFVSDHQGIPNIYCIRLADKNIAPVTFLQNGISGITETTPALSWSANGEVMVFSAFHKNSWNLYRMDLEDVTVGWAYEVGEPPSSAETASASAPAFPTEDGPVPPSATPEDGWLPPIPDPNTLYRDYALADADSVEEHDYRSKLKLDALTLGGGYSSNFGGTGQAQFLFSDMMGDHILYVSTQLQFNSPLHSDFGATYFNHGRRINYGLQAFQTNDYYTLFTDYYSSAYVRHTYRGFNAIAAYPFSRFSRIELFGGVTWVDQDGVIETYSRRSVDQETSDIGLYDYVQLGAALVFDNTVYGSLGPAGGRRSRFSVETTARDLQFTNFCADYRWYLNVNHRSVLAWRFMGATSLGRDEQVFSLGGPGTYRGTDYDDLLGTRFLVSNLEYRFPMLPFLPPSYDMLSAVAFADVAAAWGVDVPGYSKETFQPFTYSSDGGLRLKDLDSALGLGVRLNLGYFLLQYDVAWPTDLRSFDDPVKQFSIGTFF